MAHVAKFSQSACGNMMKHYERKVKENGEHIKYGNAEIDTTKSHLNYNLAPPRKSQYGYLKERLEQVYVLKRKDVKVMADWVVTIPKDLPNDKEKSFFAHAYDFLADKYGEENVISSYVHRDETTPHMHFSFVPVVFDEKKKRWKVSAKERLNRLELQKFHGELSEHMEKCFGFDVGILNGATREGNQSIDKLKRGTAQERLEKLNDEIQRITKYKAMLNERTDTIKSIKAYKGEFINEAGMVKVKRNALEQLKEYAIGYLIVEDNRPKINKLEQHNKALTNVINALGRESPELADKLVSMIKKEVQDSVKKKKTKTKSI